jgi:hypothetical protein
VEDLEENVWVVLFEKGLLDPLGLDLRLSEGVHPEEVFFEDFCVVFEIVETHWELLEMILIEVVECGDYRKFEFNWNK